MATNKQSILPPYLKPGHRIGITCPAGALSVQDVEPMIHQLKAWGFEVECGATVGSSHYKFSASDDERADEFQRMLDDDQIDAILFGRGGYGVVRIIDRIDFSKFQRQPKWLLGYSDITCVHSHLHTLYGIPSIHAHMSGGYLAKDADPVSTQSILDVLSGQPIEYGIAPHFMNRTGEAKGILVGGNLALLSDLTGTPDDLDTQNKILVIEDIGEYKYNIDRMMWQLLRAGKLSHLAGLIVGGFTDTLDNEIPFGMSEYEIVWEKVRDFDYPVCFGFPVGHQAENWALKLGVEYQFHVNDSGVILKEV
ncbi:MAG: LD-carboxypeptidase [Chitinophagaceae bacterium]|nr:LD-carboxypeptidase [Chitinophagaceae bacterium]